MASQKSLQNGPFLTFMSGVLDEHFQRTGSSALRLLEVGCGSGHFLCLLSEKYGPKLEALGIDAVESVINVGKEALAKTGSSVELRHADFMTFQEDRLFDLVIFTKSLHHFLCLEEAMKNAHKLLNPGGCLVIEEMVLDVPEPRTTRWFFDRLDLLVAAKVILKDNQKHKHSHTTGHSHAGHPHAGHGHSHSEHSHSEHAGHSHGHGHSHAEPQSKSVNLDKFKVYFDPSQNGQVRWEAIHQHHDPPFPKKDEIIKTVLQVFGSDNTKVTEGLPHFFHHIILLGLKDNEEGLAILSSYMRQEEKAIELGDIVGSGFNVVARK